MRTMSIKLIRKNCRNRYGKLVSRTDATGKSESFTWDGLALIKRDSTNLVNESAVTGGNPILAFGKDSSKVLFEDMLGSTVGSVEGGKFNAINRTSFGESNSDSELNFFTGKPQVEGLGYAFLFRNYRADQGKWQTQDPIGYPDGWNNLAYCNNKANSKLDRLGLCYWRTPDGHLVSYDSPHPEGSTLVPCGQGQLVEQVGQVWVLYLTNIVFLDCGEYNPSAPFVDRYGDPSNYSFEGYTYDCGNPYCDQSGWAKLIYTAYYSQVEFVLKYPCGRIEHIDCFQDPPLGVQYSSLLQVIICIPCNE